MAVSKNIHKGHRGRMYARVRENGFGSLAEHEALEYLLYFTNAQKDTCALAHELIDHFGSFAAVLEADENDLLSVDGVGPATARLLHIVPELSGYYTASRLKSARALNSSERIGEYLLGKFAGALDERVLLVSLDEKRRVRVSNWVGEGGLDAVSFEIRSLVEAAVRGGTKTVLMAHNHPNGVALPSHADLEATGNIVRALGVVGIRLLDHYVVTESEYMSLLEANRMPIYDFREGTMVWPRGSFT